MSSGALGINKDLEPLVRRARKAGWTVQVTRATHVLWLAPDGARIRTGLTMSAASARRAQREIERALAGGHHGVNQEWAVEPTTTGKFHVVHAQTGQALLNAAGYPRTFSTFQAAEQARHSAPPLTGSALA